MNAPTALRVCGILFCVLAVSNFLKPLEFDDHTGFVLFGQRLHGTPNLIFGPLAGLYLLVYGLGILRMRSYALPMSYLYAAYVVLNLALFTVRMPEEAWGRPLFGLVYTIIAVGVSSGAALLLSRQRAALH